MTGVGGLQGSYQICVQLLLGFQGNCYALWFMKFNNVWCKWDCVFMDPLSAATQSSCRTLFARFVKMLLLLHVLV